RAEARASDRARDNRCCCGGRRRRDRGQVARAACPSFNTTALGRGLTTARECLQGEATGLAASSSFTGSQRLGVPGVLALHTPGFGRGVVEKATPAEHSYSLPVCRLS